VFAGYAEQHLHDDPTYVRLSPNVRRRQAIVGRAIDVGLPTAGFTLDATPGRHLAVLGTSIIGADILYAAAMGLAQQHEPGTVTFVLAPLIAAADPAADALEDALTAAGHTFDTVAALEWSTRLKTLATMVAAGKPDGHTTYLIVFGADVASGLLATPDPVTFRCGHDDFRDILAGGPACGVHVLGWWRILRRFTVDLGPNGAGDLACMVALNLPANEIGSLVGEYTLEWQPRTNRALLLDRHDQRRTLIVPYVRPGTLDEIEDHV
jgi:hypothetical protein